MENFFQEQDINSLIAQLNAGLLQHLSGYDCLLCAVSSLKGKEKLTKGLITRDIYPQVAEKLECNAKNVERRIRTYFLKLYENATLTQWKKMFGHEHPVDNFEAISRFVELLSERDRIDISFDKFLEEIGAGYNCDLRGYDYIKEALRIIIQSNNKKKLITTIVCPYIAIKYNTKASRVERTIRHYIEVQYENAPPENWEKVFSSGKPLTFSQFIYTCAYALV